MSVSSLFPPLHTQLTVYYTRLLHYDIVNVSLRFSNGFSTKSIGYNMMCLGAHRI